MNQVDEVQKTLKEIQQCHNEFLTRLRNLAQQIKGETLSLADSIDIGFLLRECTVQADEIRKDLKSHHDAISKQTCYRLVLEDREKVSGNLSTGSMRVTFNSNLPHPVKQPEEFSKLCESMGVNLKKTPIGSVRFHWPTMKSIITERMEKGLPLPEGLKEVKSELSMTYRRKS